MSLELELSDIGEVLSKSGKEAPHQKIMEWFGSILHLSPNAIISIDEKQNIIFCNESARTFFGYSKSELIGQNLSILIPEEFRKTHDSYIEKFRKSNKKRAIMAGTRKVYGRRKDGSTFPIESHIERFDAEDVVILTVIIRDITSETAHETMLLESQKRLSTIISLTSDWIWESDNKNRFQYLSRGFETNTGIKRERILGKTHSEFIETREDKNLWKRYMALIRGRQPINNFKYSIINDSGNLIYLNINGFPKFDKNDNFIGYVGSGSNITELEESKLELDRQRIVFEAIFRNIPVGLILTDIARTTITINPAFTEIFGYEPEEVIGRSTEFLYPTIDEFMRVGKFRNDNDSISSSKKYECLFINKRGEEIQAETRVSMVRSIKGDILGYLGLITDITHKKNMEEILRQSDKLKAIGNLTGSVAHDFNNLLTIISGNIRYLNNTVGKGDIPDDFKEIIEDALSAAADGAALTEQLLSFSRKKPMAIETLSITDIAKGACRLVSRLMPANIIIHEDLDSLQGAFTKSDRSGFENAILNLAVNARDAMPNGGMLSFSGHKDIEHDNIPNPEPGVQYVGIVISDTGQGMSQDIIERAYDPFFTTKPMGKGTGLGLSSVFGFMEQTSGRMKIESRVGKGTKVWLFFPVSGHRYIKPVTKSDSSRNEDLISLHAGKNILVVEDEVGVRNLIRRHFSRIGFQVYTACNAVEGMDMLEKHQVDFMISDIMMPGKMKGTHLALWARHYQKELGIVLISGFNDDSSLSTALDDIPLLVKPFNMNILEKFVLDQLTEISSANT